MSGPKREILKHGKIRAAKPTKKSNPRIQSQPPVKLPPPVGSAALTGDVLNVEGLEGCTGSKGQKIVVPWTVRGPDKRRISAIRHACGLCARGRRG